MKKSISLMLLLGLGLGLGSAKAQVPPFTYQAGAVSVTENGSALIVDAAVPITAEILPGGSIWPRLGLDDDGNLYIGGTVVDYRTGKVLSRTASKTGMVQALPSGYRVEVVKQRFRITQGNKSCTFTRGQLGLLGWKSTADAFKDGNIKFASRAHQLLALAVKLEEDSRDSQYVVNDIDLPSCRIRQTGLGNPDLLVELGRSRRGGWWLTGSIEQTLLRSNDGRRWEKMRLSEGISSLISSHVVDNKEIWLAGILLPFKDDDPLLIHTSDGGKTWRNVGRGDPLLGKLPDAWLEGKRRVAMPVAP
ncbi:hypothetical protein [Pseudoduganella albidiflava]|uniref:Glycosyl hydrolase n=2 Tax=Pseudoduganella albidiflava TaxID=321983 RepID=A0ABX5S0Z5_9BURK|nr:hypothetical protein [Pseudoduganella albidiflava]QBI04607.1 hypothetical protein EYF70_30115 [Pseudoduganella albidiflava]